MHRAEGLEFDCVVVAPKEYVEEQGEDSNRRQLLYIEVTRAKRRVTVLLLELPADQVASERVEGEGNE